MDQPNPDTGNYIEIEPDGDYTITFSMTLPPQPVAAADEN
jgi:hypothetical protein